MSINEIHDVLNRVHHFYRRLNSIQQDKFCKRVRWFIKNKTFEGKGIELKNRDICVISAMAIELTWGMELYKITHFWRIIVYPEKYYSPFTNSFNAGEVNTRGDIVLSLEAVYEGNADRADGFNVALHEFAHALSFNRIFAENDDNFYYYYDKWERIADHFLRSKSGEKDEIIRCYGLKNKHEFFAVVVENFFERPSQLKAIHLEIFKSTMKLLNINPLDPSKTNFQDSLATKEGLLVAKTKRVLNTLIILYDSLTWHFRILKNYSITHREIRGGQKVDEFDIRFFIFYSILHLLQTPFRFTQYLLCCKNFHLYENVLIISYFFIPLKKVILINDLMSVNTEKKRGLEIRVLGKRNSLRKGFRFKMVNNREAQIRDIITYLYEEKNIAFMRKNIPSLPENFTFSD